MINIWTDSTLNKYTPDSSIPENAAKAIHLEMARNEYESGQIILKADEPFIISNVYMVGLEQFKFKYNFQEFISFKDKIIYPDALSNEASLAVEADFTQSIWLTFHACSTLSSGEYVGKAVISTSHGDILTDISIRVFNVTIPDSAEATFSLEYWVNAPACWWRLPEKENKDYIQQFYGHEKYSKAWWKVLESFAYNMKESRCNVLFVRTQDLLLGGQTTLDNEGTFIFDWSVFDRYVEFFIEIAGIKTLAGFHLVRQTEGEYVYVIKRNSLDKLQIMDGLIGSVEAENWLNQFLPALRNHLQEKGWYQMWIQHIQDEPADSKSWKYARNFVRRHMPGIKCHDAIDKQHSMPDFQGEMDLWIPRTDIFEENREFYDYRLTLGEQRWVYTCCVPNTPNYLNKFIDTPFWQNRLLFWGCFARGFTGFLHWGYNYWDTEDIWFGYNENAYFKGDGYIVYPDVKNNSIKNSARMINTRDSIEDYELLRLVAEKDAKLAYSLAAKLITNFHDFTWDTKKILSVRHELLECAEAVNRSQD